MVSILDYHSTATLGTVPHFRKPTEGKELDLVKFYITKNSQFRLKPGLERTIFLEPKLVSSFPDLVVVDWCPITANKWPRIRLTLDKQDLKIAHILSQMGSSNINNIIKNSTHKNIIIKSLDKLEKSEMIYIEDNIINIRPTNEIFCVKNIISIEAKIHNWKNGLEQAFHNTWYSSESYLLLSIDKATEELINHSEHLGVGLIVYNNKTNHQIYQTPSKKEQIPQSFGSWLFNEWVWKNNQLN